MLAYPSLAERLASVVKEDESLRRRMALKRIFCASETIFTKQREFIEAVFGCPVRAHYGQGECVALFQECPVGDGYHVITDYGYVEWGPPLPGSGVREIIGTSLNKQCTPLIRYRTGDHALLRQEKNCSCGWSFPKVVEDVVGRSGDLLVTPSGRYIQPNHLEYAFDHALPHFQECQIRQDAPDHLTILAVPQDGYSDKEGQAFIDAVLQRVGEPIEIELKLVSCIDRPANQKQRLVISKIGAQLDTC